VLVCAAPDILYAEDTDGDGKADVVQKLYSGFGTHNYQARVNSLQYGLDGWVYGSCGLFGGTIKSFNGKTYQLGNRDFRIQPDTGELEPVTGVTQQGRVRDDWGNWFGCDNSNLIRHYVLDDQYLKRNPYVTYPNGSVNVPADPNPNLLHPIKSDAQRFAMSGPPNTGTAACGPCIYRDHLLGDDYRGNAFTCEPVNLCVHRLKLTPKGCTFEGHRPADEQDREFLASTDNWFRPVQAVTGPDGCLWVVDMYRFVIEHPRWIPPQEVAKLDLRAGQGMGRIYRVRPKGTAPREWARFDRTTKVADCLKAFGSPNGWTRDMARQMAVWNTIPVENADLVRALTNGLDSGDLQPEFAIHCLTELQTRINFPDVLKDCMKHKHPALRRWAIRCSDIPTRLVDSFGPEVAARADDPDAQVRQQVAYTLGYWDDPRAAETLGRMALKNTGDPYITAAILSSLTEKNLPGVMATVLKEAGNQGPPPAFVAQLVRMAAATKNDKAQAELLAAATKPKDGKYARWQFEVVAGYFERPVMTVPELGKGIDEARAAALRVAGDAKTPDIDRATAIRLLGWGAGLTKEERLAFEELLSPTASPAFRSAAVAHLGRVRGTDLLLGSWKSLPPATRDQVLDIFLAEREGWRTVVDAVADKKISPAEIDAARRRRFLEQARHRGVPAREQEKLEAAFGGAVNADRAKVIQQYADVTADGDRDRGKAVFTRVCAGCHKLGDVGVHVGPDLAALANRTPAYLMQEILDPNRNLDSRYVEYQARLKDGRTIAGLLAAETATTIILRGQQRKEETLLRSDIEELHGSGKSLMPEGIEKDVSKKDMADLLTFLTSNRPPPKQFPGNTPAVVTPTDGRLTFRAQSAEIYGTDIAFEPDYKNIGMWHGPDDRVEWRVSLPRAGTFDVYLDYACDTTSAGNELVVEGADPMIRWKVAGTGAWSNYQTVKIGTVKLAAGEGGIVVRPAGPLKGALIDLRTVQMVPTK